MTAPMIDAARAYARDGWPVFPCWPILPALPPRIGNVCGCGKLSCGNNSGKHPLGPLVPNGLLSATTDPRRVEDWWGGWPNANIAIATGHVVVLDIDPRHGGDVSLAEIERKHGALPATRRARTGGGGMHLYFAPPANIIIRNSAGKIAPGIDVRGAGGYAMAPPSRHVSGKCYQWDTDAKAPCAAMPAWLAATAQEPAVKQAAPAESWRRLVRDGVSEGKRNEAVAKLAGLLLRRFVDPHVVLELVSVWNEAKCRPPLPQDEIITTVNSIARRELARRQPR
jgi:hypothetical protein